MVKVKLLLCAETFINDRNTNNFSAINIVDKFGVIAFPGFIPKLSILSVFTKEQEDPDVINFRLKAKIANAEILDNPVTAEFQKSTSAQILLVVGGIVISQPGQLIIQLLREENVLASYEIDVTTAIPLQEINTVK